MPICWAFWLRGVGGFQTERHLPLFEGAEEAEAHGSESQAALRRFAVTPVTDQRMTDVGQMTPDLVQTPRVDLHLQSAFVFGRIEGEDFQMRYRLLAVERFGNGPFRARFR